MCARVAAAWQHLVDDVDSVVQLLPLQDGVQVVEPVLEMLLALPERDDDGHLLERHTLSGLEPPARLDSRVHLLHLSQTHGDGEIHPKRPHWGHTAQSVTGCSPAEHLLH